MRSHAHERDERAARQRLAHKMLHHSAERHVGRARWSCTSVTSVAEPVQDFQERFTS
jgi:hypothetical protein